MSEPFDPYRYADLSGMQEAVEQIRKLENRLTQEAGFPVTLIAFEAAESREEQR